MATQGTNWSSPKTNIFSAVKCLTSALNSGHKAQLIRELNENCAFPIREKIKLNDSLSLSYLVRHYKTNGSSIKTRNEIKANKLYSKQV